MAFQANSSDEQVVSEFKLFTGIQLVEPVAVNPNLAELNELGIKYNNEPNYIQEPDQEGNKRAIVDVYCKIEGMDNVYPIRFYFTNKIDSSEKNGILKYRFIDKYGKHAWDLVDNKCSALEWIDTESVRPLLKGEGDFHDFLNAYFNTKKEDLCRLENIEKIFNGDFSEVKSILKVKPGNKLKALLYVSHGDNGKNYQKIYDKYFARATSNGYNYWEKHINAQIQAGYPIKGTYSYEFQEYVPVKPTSDTNTTSAPAGTSNNEQLF